MRPGADAYDQVFRMEHFSDACLYLHYRHVVTLLVFVVVDRFAPVAEIDALQLLRHPLAILVVFAS